jgi:hypothetical protein
MDMNIKRNTQYATFGMNISGQSISTTDIIAMDFQSVVITPARYYAESGLL